MMPKDLNTILAFVAVGKTNSFTKAANALGVPKSYVSRKISDLEGRLHLRLVDRTTRSVLLTEDGLHYYSVCEKAIADIEDIESLFEQGQSQPSGRLRLTCPVEFGGLVTPYLCQNFLKKYPELQLEILSTNNILDLVKDKIDVAIRPQQLADPSMRSILLGSMEWGLFASLAWTKAHAAELRKVDNVDQFDILAFNPNGLFQQKFRMNLFRKEKQKVFEFSPKIITSTLSTLIDATISGAGIGAAPDVLAQPYVQSGKLVRVYPDWWVRKENLVAVFTTRKNMPARVRALIDFLKQSSFLKNCADSTSRGSP